MSTEAVIERLLHRLTLEEKVAQLSGLSIFDLIDMTRASPSGGPAFDMPRVATLRPHGVGQVSLTWLLDPNLDTFASSLAELQERIRSVSPFGIGALVHGEGISGFLHAQGFQFPTPWALASTWNPSRAREVGGVVAAQMRDAGVHLAFAPVLDLARDPRWGRVHETYGEDPELTAQFGVEFITGVQGGSEPTGVFSAAKHFVGYGASEGGLNQARARITLRELIDVYAEPFRRAIDEAGLQLVMNSYNSFDGVPASADRWLFTDFLRGQLGFDGVVVSDYDSISMLYKTFHTATTPGGAAAQALSAGLDTELPSNETFAHLAAEVDEGRLPVEVVDTAVRRVLALKARAGLVPDLTPPPSRQRRANPEEARRLGEDIARESTVLLTNNGILPLKAGTLRIAVTGPAADELRIHFGAYSAAANEEQPLAIAELMAGRVNGYDPATTIFTDLFQLTLPGIEPVFEKRTRELHPQMLTILEALTAADPTVDVVPFGSLSDTDLDTGSLRERFEGYDVVIAAIGERTGWVGNHTAGEGRTSATLQLPGNQIDLVESIAKLGVPVVSVVVSGRPLILDRVAAVSAAVLVSPLQGEAGPRTIAQIVFGVVEPGGRLVSTLPRHVGQLPLYHGHEFGSGYAHPTGARHLYADFPDPGPLFPFGHGLGYTTFEAELVEASVAGHGRDQILNASVKVTNTGSRAGSTVVQLYGRDEAGIVVRPVRQLLGFTRVELRPGDSGEVMFHVPASRLIYTMPDGTRGLEAGDITVLVGFSADDTRSESTIQVSEIAGA